MAYFEKVHDLEWPVFLDSANTDTSTSRYDIIAASPYLKVETRNKETQVINEQGEALKRTEDDPFSVIQSLLHAHQQQSTNIPFAGGAIGYFSYDLGRRIESIDTVATDAENLPEMAVGIYDWALVIDHQLQCCHLASFGTQATTKAKWHELIERFAQSLKQTTPNFQVSGELTCNLDKQGYTEAFERIQDYITEGDCYQVNLTKRFEVHADGDALFAYKLLRKNNAAPFSAYFKTDDVDILSASPERLLQVAGDHVETKPIKGTRPRDLADANRDLQLAVELQSSEKDRAENLMIVDLLRNDLGKVCAPGSIKVPKPFDLESFTTVHHLVSTITGELSDDKDAIDLLRACFPGGSITGAPKLRAMEIIEELEPHRRGIYCGSIAYIGFDGNMDSSITIRTMVYSNNRLRFWAGGGIVTDSNVDAEFQEVLDKAAALFTVINKLR
jgi:para-aminobenzoate synthetase component 1